MAELSGGTPLLSGPAGLIKKKRARRRVILVARTPTGVGVSLGYLAALLAGAWGAGAA